MEPKAIPGRPSRKKGGMLKESALPREHLLRPTDELTLEKSTQRGLRGGVWAEGLHLPTVGRAIARLRLTADGPSKKVTEKIASEREEEEEEARGVCG